MKFREIVRKERLNQKWTLKEMGEKIHKSANAIYHYEKGNRAIDSETLELYGNIFGYSWCKVDSEGGNELMQVDKQKQELGKEQNWMVEVWGDLCTGNTRLFWTKEEAKAYFEELKLELELEYGMENFVVTENSVYEKHGDFSVALTDIENDLY